jgi:chitin disaccharide deacetylase
MPMKYLIVNADDFGASHGINHGIIEAHERGIVTSTSLLVGTPWSEEAAELAKSVPGLSVGLHTDVRHVLGPAADTGQRLYEALQRQLSRFEELINRRPTHLDAHHNVHRDGRALPHFLALAEEYRLPLREHSPVRYFSKFYGQWGGETHLEQISPDSLRHMLMIEIGDGITELSCHPGYVEGYSGSYAAERQTELRTLCDPAIREMLAACGIQLINYHDLQQVLSCGAP